MKSFAVFFLTAALVNAADFYTGQAARLVIGQTTFTAQDSGASDQLLGGVGGVAYANDTLFVTDSNRLGASPTNHRVLVFRNLSGQLPALRSEIAPDISRCPVCTGRADLILGQPNFETTPDLSLSASGLRLPLAVATDGKMLAVADTDNNRVLIWRNLPTVNGQAADIVLGQADMKSNKMYRPPTASSLGGPQGVWIQDGRIFVADTANDRVLIWNRIPTANGQAADIVLGQANFTTEPPQNLAQKTFEPKATTLLSPTSVTSDGTRVLVTDLGHNRVLVWNSIPTTNQQPADVVLGQPDMVSAISNNSSALCASNGTDSDGKATYPDRCKATLSFPRFALTDGRRLFIADGGNDRVLVYSTLPTSNGVPADIILGQINEKVNQVSDSAEELRRSSSDSLRTPLAMAFDGSNLYVTDPFNRRVMVFSVGDTFINATGVRNMASREVYAVGSVALTGSITADNELTITITGTDSETGSEIKHDYKHKVLKDDTLNKVMATLVDLINAGNGDPLVLAMPNATTATIILVSRLPGVLGNEIEYSTTTSTDATITATTGGSTLSGGMDAAKIAPGSLVTIFADDLTDQTASAPADAFDLPKELAGVQVYFDGIRAPLLSVSPTEVSAQMPFHVLDATSVNAWVRSVRKDGTVKVTTPTAVPIIGYNPGIFAEDGTDPRVGIVMHSSSRAHGTVSVDGSANAGDVAKITIQDRTYSYTVVSGDTLDTIQDHLIELINQDPVVEAYRAGQWNRIRLRARVEGPEGNGIAFSASTSDSAQVILTATNTNLCCANVAYSRVTPENPAQPGETVVVYATGLGIVEPDEARLAIVTGEQYTGTALNKPTEFVSALAGGKTANVLLCGLKPGTIGVYEVHLELNSSMSTNPYTQATIAQDVYVSNIITFPVYNPTPSQ